jgi:uncharacterized protein (DUF1810 family)
MKFIIPRLAMEDGLAGRYSITSFDEARAYLSSPLLGGRYRECVGALLPLFAADVRAIFGEADAKNLHASLTLFSAASPRVSSSKPCSKSGSTVRSTRAPS